MSHVKRVVYRGTARQAFTLIELLIVLVILGALAAIVVPKFTGRAEEAKITQAKTQLAAFDNALSQFEADNGRFPTNEEGLRALVEQVSNAPKWRPYMKTVPNDPWGNPYVYKFPGVRDPNGCDVYSTGPDGRESQDDIAN